MTIIIMIIILGLVITGIVLLTTTIIKLKEQKDRYLKELNEANEFNMMGINKLELKRKEHYDTMKWLPHNLLLRAKMEAKIKKIDRIIESRQKNKQ